MTNEVNEMSAASRGYPMARARGRFCKKHGGDVGTGDEGWLCDTCARSGIDKCKCGGHARIFGEALMSSVFCEQCDERVSGVDVEDIRAKWNAGMRGWITG
jgi:hypothetical protein